MKKHILKSSLIAVCLCLLTACEKESQPTPNKTSSNTEVISNGNNSEPEGTVHNVIPKITPILIAQGDLSGNGAESIPQQNIVITNNEDWENLKTAMNSYRDNTTQYYFSEEYIDFLQYQVIAVFDEVKTHGGFSIDIVEITEYSDKIVVEVSKLKQGGLLCVITQPFHIVKIPISNKEIVFKNNF